MIQKSLLVLALIFTSFSNYAATLTCKGVDSEQGQVHLVLEFENQNAPLKVSYTVLMNDGFEAVRSWDAEASQITRTTNELSISGTVGDYSWYTLNMNLKTQDGVHFNGESYYEEDDSGWELVSNIKNIECVLSK